MSTSIVFDESIDNNFIGPVLGITDEYGLLDEEEYSWLDNIQIIRRTRIKCITCDNYTLYADRLSRDDDNDIYNYECKKCRGLYAVCFKCQDVTSDNVNLSQLISHHNYERIEEDGPNYKVMLSKYIPCDLSDSEIVYTESNYFFDENIFGPITGHDGGFDSTWKCKCGTFTITDK